MKPIIAVTTGDPLGIGPEVSLKAACDAEVLRHCRPLLIGDRTLLLERSRALTSGMRDDPAAWREVSRSGFMEWGSKQGDDISLDAWEEGAAFFDMGSAGPLSSTPGPTPEGGRAALMYVKQAVALIRAEAAAAMATAPLSKEALRLSGRDFPGHTEILADLCGIDRSEVAMMFVSDEMKVALLTTHLGLRDAIESLTTKRLESRLRLVRDEHLRWFGQDPRIAVCALNPHGGEGGLFGREESELLRPAVDAAIASGVKASGPWPADTVFTRAARGEFDVVLALYHDQGTIAVKTRSFGGAVNMTLGLPLLRTSVDHGTAYDIAGRGVADCASMGEAIRLAAHLATPRSTGS